MSYLKKIEDKDFKFLDGNTTWEAIGGELTPIELLGHDRFAGIIYIYGKVNIREKDDETGTLAFQFKILNRTDDEIALITADGTFVQHIGEVLNSIILDDFE